MNDRAHKRPRMYEGRYAAAGQGGPRSPEGLPHMKRPRRDYGDHPANKLPPSLRGRVTLPGDRDWDEQVKVHNGQGQANRESQRSREGHQSSNKSRPRAAGDRELHQPREKQLEHGKSKDTQATSQDPADRLRASRYDMNSTGRGGGGPQAGRGGISSSDRSDRHPSAPLERDNRSASSSRQAGRRSSSPARHRPGDPHSMRAATRPDSRSDPRRRSGDGAHRERSSRHDHPRQSGASRTKQSADKLDKNDKESACRALTSSHGTKERRQAGDVRNKAEHNRDNKSGVDQQPPAAAIEGLERAAVVADQHRSPVALKPTSEEGETAPTPRTLPAADGAVKAVDHQQQQPSSAQQVVGESSLADAAGDSGKGASGRSSNHQPIKFTLDKLPSVAAEELKPKQSSKYTVPAELQAAPTGPVDNVQGKDPSKHSSSEQEQQRQHHQVSPAADPGSSEQPDKQNSFHKRDSSRGTRRDHHDKPRDHHDHQQQRKSREHQHRQQEGRSNDRHGCEPSQDATRDHSRGRSSRQPKTDSSRPDGAHNHRATSGSAQTTPIHEGQPPQTATSSGRQEAGEVSRGQPEQRQQQKTPVSVVLGAPLSRLDVGRDGVFTSSAVLMCAEGQAKTAALRTRQAGPAAVQLRGLPISQQLCYKEVWEEVCQLTGTCPEELDGNSAALKHRAAAAAATSSQYSSRLLTPVQPMRPVTLGTGAEEAHLKHLQAVIDSFTEVSAAPYCVQMHDGGSVLLPAELQGVLW